MYVCATLNGISRMDIYIQGDMGGVGGGKGGHENVVNLTLKYEILKIIKN